MRRLWIAALLLAAMFSCALFNSLYLRGLATQISGLLVRAEAAAEAGRWDQAGALTQDAAALWEGHDFYLHVSLRHTDTDQIRTGLQEVDEYLGALRHLGDDAAAIGVEHVVSVNAQLTTQLKLLWEAEQFNLENIL